MSADFVNHPAATARWKADTAPAGISAADVEDTARVFLVTDSGVSVWLHAAWASHAAHDVTEIEVTGTSGVATLRSTFGFSPNRLDGSVLTLTRGGTATTMPVPDEPVGSEYDRQVNDLARLLDDPASRGRAVAEASRTVAVIERIYASARMPTPSPPRAIHLAGAGARDG